MDKPLKKQECLKEWLQGSGHCPIDMQPISSAPSLLLPNRNKLGTDLNVVATVAHAPRHETEQKVGRDAMEMLSRSGQPEKDKYGNVVEARAESMATSCSGASRWGMGTGPTLRRGPGKIVSSEGSAFSSPLGRMMAQSQIPAHRTEVSFFVCASTFV